MSNLCEKQVEHRRCIQIVKGRWLPFWEACIYLTKYYEQMKNFIIKIEEKYKDSKFYSDLKRMLLSKFTTEKHLLLEYLAENAVDFLKVLKLFESEEPINHLINIYFSEKSI